MHHRRKKDSWQDSKNNMEAQKGTDFVSVPFLTSSRFAI